MSTDDEWHADREATRGEGSRRRAPATMDDLVGEFSALVPQLTDEEWRARDAMVAEQLARDEAATSPDQRLNELEARGFPKRALVAYRQGLRPVEAVTALLGIADLGIVVIAGGVGVGKTCAVTWLAARRRERWRYVKAAELLATSRFDLATRGEWLDGALVVDDIGAEYADPRGSFAADFGALVDAYYESMRPLILTTNLPMTAPHGDRIVKPMAERYGQRTFDRLRECGRWVSMSGDSRRRTTKGGAR